MRNLGKINGKQLYNLWRNLSVALLAVIMTVCLSSVLPYYLAPIIALLVATGLYFFVYNNRISSSGSCLMPVIVVLYGIVAYAFITIIINLLHVWGVYDLPHEFLFFTEPFIPALILSPVCLVVISSVYIRHNRMKMCIDCRMRGNVGGRRGAQAVLNAESHYQIKNFIFMSAGLTIIVWLYYIFFYVSTNMNARDTYVFIWLTILGVLLDWLYFCIRYYNLYLDFKETDDFIPIEELKNQKAATYLRFYVICGDDMYLTRHAKDVSNPNREVIDTPFFTNEAVYGMLNTNVKKIISDMTGYDNGELRFFFGRKSIGETNISILRYFYFLDGKPDDYNEMKTRGRWVSFERIKYLYSHQPQQLSELAVFDITRLATIMLTEKIFDEEGYRKSKIKSYQPSFSLPEVKDSELDFQDDKWIEISLFNSDVPLYRFKKWWKDRFLSPGK